jgi:hypothetical protein
MGTKPVRFTDAELAARIEADDARPAAVTLPLG